MHSLTRSGLFAGAALLLAGSAAAQTTWHVPGDFTSIQAAINTAAPGDTVAVGPGNWPTSNLFLGKSIVLRSTAGPELTILDGQGTTRLLGVANGVTAAARIEGFTFWRGFGTDGGAIAMSGDASPVVANCIFRGCVVGNGSQGSQGSTGSDSSTIGATGGSGGSGFSGTPGRDGGAVWVEAGSPRFVNCVFYDNRAGNGGKGGPWGVFTDPGKGGTGGFGGSGGAGGRGGAIATRTGTPELIGCAFLNNRAGRGGEGGNGGSGGPGGNGGPFADGPTGTGGSASSGSSGARGGALAVLSAGGGFSVTNCVFAGNQPGPGGSGGSGGFGSPSGSNGSNGSSGTTAAILGWFGSGLSLDNSVLNGNSSTTSDIQWMTGSAPVVSHCITDFAPLAGAGNFQADPLLGFGNDPWDMPRPLPGSPCIDAGDASALDPVVTHDIDGFPRRIDDPLTADGANAGAPALDIGAAEYLPPAHVAVLDCPFNPAGSLTHVSGLPTPGGVMAFTLDNPADTQGISLVFGAIALGSFASDANPCGLPIPGFGMGGAGAIGGLAGDPNASLPLQFVGLWTGASTVPWNVGLPNDPALHGLAVTLQGVFVEAVPAAVPIGLTTAVHTVIGA